jgi:hypothetical protein
MVVPFQGTTPPPPKRRAPMRTNYADLVAGLAAK